MRKIIESDGSTTTWRKDGDIVTVNHMADIESLLKRNEYLRNNTTGQTRDKSIKHIANVSNYRLMKWCQEDGINIRDVMKNWRGYSKWLRRKVAEENKFKTSPDKTPGWVGYNPGLESAISKGRKLGV